MPSMPDPDRMPHPGRTLAERRALGGIGLRTSAGMAAFAAQFGAALL